MDMQSKNFQFSIMEFHIVVEHMKNVVEATVVVLPINSIHNRVYKRQFPIETPFDVMAGDIPNILTNWTNVL